MVSTSHQHKVSVDRPRLFTIRTYAPDSLLLFRLLCVDFSISRPLKCHSKLDTFIPTSSQKTWRSLAKFYQEVFGCVPVSPERHLRGKISNDVVPVLFTLSLTVWIFGFQGQTERDRKCSKVFTYIELQPKPATAVNRPGYGHIAFGVDDVAKSAKGGLECGRQNCRRHRDAANRLGRECDLVLRDRS